MKRFKACLAVLLVLLLSLSLVACGTTKRISKAEALRELPSLVEASRVLNEIYFGDGFPPRGDAVLPGNGYYYVDGEVYGFESIEQIKEATEKVFTPEYAGILYAAAFDGLAGEDGVVRPPRYMEGELGLMQHMGDSVWELADRRYDYETLKVKKYSRGRATLSVVTTDAGGNAATVELILVRQTDAEGTVTYRLDSPTY